MKKEGFRGSIEKRRNLHELTQAGAGLSVISRGEADMSIDAHREKDAHRATDKESHGEAGHSLTDHSRRSPSSCVQRSLTACLWRALTLCLLVAFVCLRLGALRSEAAPLNFPSIQVQAEAAVCVDKTSGALLYEKNAHERLYPASITKVMTALVVLEHARLDDMVTFSHDAVYNVDVGSSNAQIEEGDVLSVRDCLYALLLKSANEAANALAEHVAGSRAAFAELMNEKARALGCTDTHFDNPSGLHSEQHYTSAYDMALIGLAAMDNPDFMEIESRDSYRLAPCIRVPDGKLLYMEHKMLLDTGTFADKRAVAGKTGYTSAAGNTLLTMGREGERELVTVVLKDKMPYHYRDTIALFDLGFNQFENVEAPESLFDREQLRRRLLNDKIIGESCKPDELYVDGKQWLTVPRGADLEALQLELNYNLPKTAPRDAVAELIYTDGVRELGRYYLQKEPSIEILLKELPEETKVKVAVISLSTLGLLVLAGFGLMGGGSLLMHLRGRRREQQRLRDMKEKRRERLKRLNVSEEEFERLLREKRSGRGVQGRQPECALPDFLEPEDAAECTDISDSLEN